MQPDAFQPFFANALDFAFKQATREGKPPIGALIIVSIFSGRVIIPNTRQLIRARKAAKRFFTSYRATRDPLEIARRGEEFDGAPAYELYYTGAEETEYQLKNNPFHVTQVRSVSSSAPTSSSGPTATGAETDILARQITTKISQTSFDAVRVTLEGA